MKLLAIISHDLLEIQKEEARKKLDIEVFEELPVEYKRFWRNIPSDGNLPLDQLNKVIDWIFTSSKEGDYIWVQGEYGATYYIVDYCFKTKRIPIYATTDRVVKEYEYQGKIKVERLFQHRQFRRYIKVI